MSIQVNTHRESRTSAEGGRSTASEFGLRSLRKVFAALMAIATLAPAAGFAQYPNPNYSYLPYPSMHPYAPMQPMGPAGPNPELVPQHQSLWYDDDSMPDLVLKEALRGTYARVEYLGWNIQQPGNNLLSAPIQGVDNPRDPFLIQTANSTAAVAEVLSTNKVDFNALNGIRGTVGIPFEMGSLEGSVWGVNQGFEQIEDKPFLRNNGIASPRFIAIGLLTDGVPGNRLLLFDKSLKANYRASAWGSDVNLYYAMQNPRLGLGLQPLAGFRYMNYDEQLTIKGEFDNSAGAYTSFGTLTTPIESQIRSAVNNNVYAAQVGFKADFKHQFFTLAFEPKLAFGANDYNARVSTNNLRTFDDPSIVNGPNDFTDSPSHSSTGKTVFSPTIDLGVSAKVHFTDWAHLRVGYNFICTGGLARADRAIYYNDTGLSNPPAITAQQKFDSIVIQGFTVGAEFLLP